MCIATTGSEPRDKVALTVTAAPGEKGYFPSSLILKLESLQTPSADIQRKAIETAAMTETRSALFSRNDTRWRVCGPVIVDRQLGPIIRRHIVISLRGPDLLDPKDSLGILEEVAAELRARFNGRSPK